MTASSVRMLRLGLLNPALDLAHVVEIVGDARRDRCDAEAALERCALRRRWSRGCSGPRARLAPRCPPIRRRRTAARTPMRGLISIGSGVVGVAQEIVFMVRAAVAGRAAADVAGEILGRELERRERRRLADLAGEHLIDRRADRGSPAPSVRLGTAPLSQPDAAAACISATPPARFRLLTTTSESFERLEDLQRRRQLEVRAGGGRRPRRHVRPVRDVHEPGAHRPARVGLRERRRSRHHRIEQRQRQRGSHASQERPPRQRELGDEHQDLL